VAFQRFGVQDFRNPEDKEQGYFGVGNLKIMKEACGHGVGGRIGQNYAISTFQHSEDREDKGLDIKVRELMKPKIPFWKKVTVMFEDRLEEKDLWIE
jgi:hypothetical protein